MYAAKKMLVCDMDNTLYDWVRYFTTAFYAMVDEAIKILDCDREQLLNDFKKVHQRYGDSEHPFALLETDTVRRHFQGRDQKYVTGVLDPAFHAFNSARKQSLTLNDGVRNTLDHLAQNGILLVGHTESKYFAAVDRLVRLGIADFFARIYCRERSISLHPNEDAARRHLANVPLSKIVELSHHQRKPDESVLLEICTRENVPAANAAYVGDSLTRDILMAKRANVFAIWAAYGVHADDEAYERLVRISHWTPDEVERERQLKSQLANIVPDFIATSSFAEVEAALQLVESAA